MPCFLLNLALFQQGFAHHIKTSGRNNKRSADPKAQPEIKTIGNTRGDRRHTRCPSAQDICVKIKHWINHQIGEHSTDKRPHHHVKRQDKTNQQMPQIRSYAKHRSGQYGLYLSCKIDKWNWQDLNCLRQKNARQGGHNHIEQSPHQTNTTFQC